MQPQKDYYAGNTSKEAWWKLYQPLGFSIATKNNALGTKSQLKSMVTAAHNKGLKVIVDVVANHLAGLMIILIMVLRNMNLQFMVLMVILAVAQSFTQKHIMAHQILGVLQMAILVYLI